MNERARARKQAILERGAAGRLGAPSHSKRVEE